MATPIPVWHGGTFTIYSVGDGQFLTSVLNSIAALTSSGVIESLGLLGLLLGLLTMSFRGAATGGRDFDLGGHAAALLLFAVLFHGRAHVFVDDVSLSAGDTSENVYTVAGEIPFGVAATGWIVSNISLKLTERMEQAFGDTEEVTSIREVGFGRTLDWVAAIRFAGRPELNNADGSFGIYKKNMTYYLRYCSSQAIAREPGRVA